MPLLTWPALLCSLGWNFLEYGLISPPEGQGIDWGFLIPGVLFEVMGLVPLLGVVGLLRTAGPARTQAVGLRGPGQPPRSRPPAVPQPSVPTNARQAALAGLASSFGAAASLTAASARLGGVRAGADTADLEAGPAAAMVDRLEALAELRETGLLEEREYEAAKAAVLRDLEALP